MGSKGSKGNKNSRKNENVEAAVRITTRVPTLGNYGLNYNYFPRMRYPFLYFPLPPSNFSVSRPSMSYAVMPPSYGGRLLRPPPLPVLQLPKPWYQGYFCQSLPATLPRQTGFVFNLPPRSATAADYFGTQYYASFANRYPFSNPFVMLLSNPAAALTSSVTTPTTICFPRQQIFPPALPSISLPAQTQQYYSQSQLPSLISQTLPPQLALPSSQPVETIIVKRKKRSRRRKAPQQVVVHEKPIIIKERSSSPTYRNTMAPIVQPQVQYIPIPYPVPQQSAPQTITTQEVIEEVIPPPQIINEQVPIGYTTSQTLVQPPSQAVLTNSRKYIVIDAENPCDRTIPNYKILDPKDLSHLNEIPCLNNENFSLLNEGLLNLQTSQPQLFGFPMQTAQITQPYFTQKPTIVQNAQDTDITGMPNLSQLQTFYNTESFQTLPNENLNQTTKLSQNPVQPRQIIIDSGNSNFQPSYTTVAPTFASALTTAVSGALNGQIKPNLMTTNLTLT